MSEADGRLLLKLSREMPIAESDFKAEELDSLINVIGLKPSDPLDGFGGKSKKNSKVRKKETVREKVQSQDTCRVEIVGE